MVAHQTDNQTRYPIVATLPNGETIDLIALEQLISQDIADGKKPCMVIGRAGTPVTGEVDSLKGLRMLCDKMGVWLHVEGYVYNDDAIVFRCLLVLIGL